MRLKNIFELKASKDKTIYSKIVQQMGKSAVYTDVNYKAIATEGYRRNWIIFRCMQEIIKGAIQLHFKVVKVNQNGEKEEIKGHPALSVLEKPNPLYSRSELIKRAIAYKYIGGEVPFHRVKASGKVKELYVYRPDMVKFTPTGDTEKPYIEIKYNEIPIEAKDFMLWKEFNPTDYLDGLGHGMSMLEPVLKNGDLLNELVNWNVSLLQNGGNLSGVFTTPDTLGDAEYERTKTELRNSHQGSRNVGKFMLLEGGMSYISTGVNPKDMDWNEGKRNTMLDICIGMGVDPIVIGFNEQSSYNNKNEAEKGLYTKTVIPLMQDLAQHLQNFLELQENEYLEIDYSHIPCLQEDIKEMFDRVNNSTFMTINEKREKVGLEPIKNGDKIMLPMNLVEFGEEKEVVGKNITSEGEEKSLDFLY
ncbi:phage portal protein [Clostridium haemolyticum]|uniref:Portal protein n=1 Tax=Clostridium haemolyticum NCTC 9693 TaxID=1443114 RepID=A0ABR4TGX1_CLOHA|nr:phage portal protein [Clostridium haemolyticum]KEI18268.1 hypothetical protein Z960_03910 [Clostridium haemolyticum NCTC 9693]KGN04193.1 hypothetical protein Z961_04390 [Clostridium haemolyticum NCTC 8350]